MTYNALRKGRWSGPNRVYLVTTVTNRRTPIFKDFECARTLIGEIRELQEGGTVNLLCWVLVPDHLHLLLQVKAGNLGTAMGRLKGTSARRINKLMGRRGSLWQKAYHDRGLRNHEDPREMARYIVSNPLRAGLVDDIGQYPHWDAIWL